MRSLYLISPIAVKIGGRVSLSTYCDNRFTFAEMEIFISRPTLTAIFHHTVWSAISTHKIILAERTLTERRH